MKSLPGGGAVATGQLRVYFGAAPGVGKTYKMLEEGHRRLERGTDVVVGFVETHGRKHTEELLEGGVDEHAVTLRIDDRDHRRQQIERAERRRIAPPLAEPVGFRRVHFGSLPSSRLIAAMSLSLRAIAAFISVTRSRYFW